MNNLDPVVSDPPSDDELARKLMMAVDAIDDETTRAIVMALQGHGESDTRFHEDQFRWQLSHRLDQAGIRADRSG